MEYTKKLQLKKNILRSIVVGLSVGVILLLVYRSTIYSLGGFLFSGIAFIIILYVIANLKESARIKKIEDVFPDFLQLMRSGHIVSAI